MEVIWHNNESVQQESSLVSVFEYGVHEEFRVDCSQKQGAPLKRYGGDGVGRNDTPRVSDREKHTPGASKGKEKLVKGGTASTNARKYVPQGLKAN